MHLLFIEFFQNLKKYLCRILSWEILDVEKIRQQASSCLQEIYLKTGNGLWYVRVLIAYFVFCLFRLSIKCSLDGAPDWTLSFEGLNRSFENASTKKQIHQIPEFSYFFRAILPQWLHQDDFRRMLYLNRSVLSALANLLFFYSFLAFFLLTFRWHIFSGGLSESYFLFFQMHWKN